MSTCNECKWADWEHPDREKPSRRNGRVVEWGICTYPVTLPACTQHVWLCRNITTNGFGEGCPTWERRAAREQED